MPHISFLEQVLSLLIGDKLLARISDNYLQAIVEDLYPKAYTAQEISLEQALAYYKKIISIVPESKIPLVKTRYAHVMYNVGLLYYQKNTIEAYLASYPYFKRGAELGEFDCAREVAYLHLYRQFHEHRMLTQQDYTQAAQWTMQGFLDHTYGEQGMYCYDLGHLNAIGHYIKAIQHDKRYHEKLQFLKWAPKRPMARPADSGVALNLFLDLLKELPIVHRVDLGIFKPTHQQEYEAALWRIAHLPQLMVIKTNWELNAVKERQLLDFIRLNPNIVEFSVSSTPNPNLIHKATRFNKSLTTVMQYYHVIKINPERKSIGLRPIALTHLSESLSLKGTILHTCQHELSKNKQKAPQDLQQEITQFEGRVSGFYLN